MTSSNPSNPLGALLHLWRLLNRKVGWARTVRATVLLLAAGATEGLALLLLVPLLQVLGAGSGPGAASGLLGRALSHLGTPSLLGILLVFVAVCVLRAALARQKAVELTALRLEMTQETRVALYGAIAHAAWPFLRRHRQGDLHATLTTEIDRFGEALYYALELPARAIMMSVHVAIATTIAPLATPIVLLVGLGIAWLVRGFLHESLRLGEALSQAYRSLHRQITEFLSGLKITKSFGAEDLHTAAFARVLDHLRTQMLDFTRGSATARMLQEIAGGVAVALFIWTSITLLGLSVAEVLVLALIFFRLMPMLQGLQDHAQQLLHAAPAVATVDAMRQACEAARETLLPFEAPIRPAHVQLNSLRFRHEEGRDEVLHDVSLDLPAGSLTLLTGASGAGKSTVLDILAGLLQADRGALIVDGQHLGPEELAHWRRCVAYVAQEAFLFQASILDNLLIGSPRANRRDVEEALARAGAKSFVTRLPQGLETVLSNGGSGLSGGERQRLSLARALLRRPALLVLDEPTSALDRDTELEVLRSIEALRGSTTLVMATHRPERVQGADAVYEIDRGVVARYGSAGLVR